MCRNNTRNFIKPTDTINILSSSENNLEHYAFIFYILTTNIILFKV